jgi:hypothetical protein
MSVFVYSMNTLIHPPAGTEIVPLGPGKAAPVLQTFLEARHAALGSVLINAVTGKVVKYQPQPSNLATRQGVERRQDGPAKSYNLSERPSWKELPCIGPNKVRHEASYGS